MSQASGAHGPQPLNPSERIERGPCLRCGCKGEIGCKHGTVRFLSVRVA